MARSEVVFKIKHFLPEDIHLDNDEHTELFQVLTFYRDDTFTFAFSSGKSANAITHYPI